MPKTPAIPLFAALLLAGLPMTAQRDVLTTHRLKIEKTTRTYHVHQPKAGADKLPILIVLHPTGSAGKALRELAGFKPMVAAGDVLAVYPEANNGAFVAADLAFLDAMIDELLQRDTVDGTKLLITGFGTGGLMVYAMAAKSRHEIRAAGAVSALPTSPWLEQFPLTRPINFALIHGTKDPLMPYEGEPLGPEAPSDKPRAVGAEEILAQFVKVNELTEPAVESTLGDKDPRDGCTNLMRRWQNKVSGRRAMLVQVIGGGHVPPGWRSSTSDKALGPVCKDFHCAEVMWAFLSEGALKPKPLDPALEKALRIRVAALFDGLLKGDMPKCMALADKQTVEERGRETIEQGFQTVMDIARMARLGKEDRVITSIEPLDGDAARVDTEIRVYGRTQANSEVWVIREGQWFLRDLRRP